MDATNVVEDVKASKILNGWVLVFVVEHVKELFGRIK